MTTSSALILVGPAFWEAVGERRTVSDLGREHRTAGPHEMCPWRGSTLDRATRTERVSSIGRRMNFCVVDFVSDRSTSMSFTVSSFQASLSPLGLRRGHLSPPHPLTFTPVWTQLAYVDFSSRAPILVPSNEAYHRYVEFFAIEWYSPTVPIICVVADGNL